jgi:hypothetical protein
MCFKTPKEGEGTMRKWGLGGLAALLVVLVAGATLPLIPVHAATAPIKPGVSLADIPIGSPIAEVVTRLGAPTQVRLVSADGTLAYIFSTYGITAYTRSHVVFALTSTNSLIVTNQGIGLGAPAAAINAAFGQPRSTGVVEGFRGPMYPALGIAFGLDRQTVAAVMVFAPQAATPGTTSSPDVGSRATPDQSAPAAAPGEQTAAQSPQQVGVAHTASPDAAGIVPPARSPFLPVAQPGESPAPDAAAPGAESVAVAGSGVSLAEVASTAHATAAVPPSAPEPQLPAQLLAVQPASEGELQPMARALAIVRDVRAFSLETRYLSIAGYLRYLLFSFTRKWVIPQESERLVQRDAGPSAH